MDKFETLSAGRTQSDLKPLRILIVLNLHWDSRLGAVRVYAELAEQWRAAGHIVERFGLSDAFPKARESRAGFAVRQVMFAHKAAAFVRKNAHRFDIVDAVIGSLPSSKKKLGYKGLLVARSVGLYRLYDRFERSTRHRWPRPPSGKILGRILYKLIRRRLISISDKSVTQADLVNVPNQDEADHLRAELGLDRPIIVQPYGLTAEARQALSQTAETAEVRLARKKVSFIGMWGPRKGSFDWAAIIQQIWKKIPETHFHFLGTMVDPQTILFDLGVEKSERIELVSEYSPTELPRLLADATVGAFPSYAEGFGLAVLEQLGAGIPTVAFNVAGPRDILRASLPELLVPSGDIDAFADAVCKILELDRPAYHNLSQRSAEVAAQFSWAAIAEETLSAYRRLLPATPIA